METLNYTQNKQVKNLLEQFQKLGSEERSQFLDEIRYKGDRGQITETRNIQDSRNPNKDMKSRMSEREGTITQRDPSGYSKEGGPEVTQGGKL